MPISINNKEIVAINCEGREIVRAHAGLSLVFSKQEDLYGGMDISSIADLVMFRDLINTGTCTWNGVSTNTYKGNPIATGGLGSTWYVTANIDMSAVCSPSLGSWVPIGTSSRPFAGTIEGLNFTISNLYINQTTATAGLFAFARGLSISNLSISGDVTSNGYASICLARVVFTTSSPSNILTNVTTYGTVNSSASYTGGVLAYANSSLASTNAGITLTGCINYATINGTGAVGGLCGYIRTTSQYALFDSCINYGAINATSGIAAGIASTVTNINAIFTNCINYGNITGSSNGAGIAQRGVFTYCENAITATISGDTVHGIAIANMAQTSNGCVNNGTLVGMYDAYGICEYGSGSNHINNSNINVGFGAGICRFAVDVLSNCTNNGNITCTSGCGGICIGSTSAAIINCTNNGSVSGGSYVGGIVSDTSSPIYNCINNGDVTGTDVIGGIVGYKNNGSIYNCINNGAISGQNNIGGIVGRLAQSIAGAVVQACRNNGNVTQSYTIGSKYGGGIAGSVGFGSLIANLNTAQLITTPNYNINAGVISGDTPYATLLASNYYDNTIETTYKAFSDLEDRTSEGEGRPTSNLLGNSLLGAGSGWTTDNWVFTAGEYPTPRMD